MIQYLTPSLRINEKSFILENITDCAESRNLVYSLSESEIRGVNEKIVDQLYKLAISKYTEIDFEDLTASNGDITKFNDYEIIKGCLETLESIRIQSGGQKFNELEIVSKTFKYLHDLSPDFIKAIKQNKDFARVLYNSIVLGVIQSLSILINVSVEYLQRPNADDYQIVMKEISKFNKKELTIIKTLDRFNKSVEKGEVKILLTKILDKNAFVGTVVGGTILAAAAVVLGIILIVIPIIRELIYQFYYSRIKISEYLQQQSYFLEINATTVEYNSSMDKQKRKEIAKKQREIANKLTELSNKIDVSIAKGTKDKEETFKEESIASLDVKNMALGDSVIL